MTARTPTEIIADARARGVHTAFVFMDGEYQDITDLVPEPETTAEVWARFNREAKGAPKVKLEVAAAK